MKNADEEMWICDFERTASALHYKDGQRVKRPKGMSDDEFVEYVRREVEVEWNTEDLDYSGFRFTCSKGEEKLSYSDEL